MGIFEIIGELINPGSIGDMDFKDKNYEIRQKLIPLRFIISLVIICLLEYLFVFQRENFNDFRQLFKLNALFIIYLFISYFIRIKPDYNNLGWVPFLINNPFRFSDNINRIFVIFKMLFMPGKFISKSIVRFYKYCKS